MCESFFQTLLGYVSDGAAGLCAADAGVRGGSADLCVVHFRAREEGMSMETYPAQWLGA